jgi:hypothetical protein
MRRQDQVCYDQPMRLSSPNAAHGSLDLVFSEHVGRPSVHCFGFVGCMSVANKPAEGLESGPPSTANAMKSQ